VPRRCRSHTDDVQDLNWAPDGSALASGSIDNTAVLHLGHVVLISAELLESCRWPLCSYAMQH
jgi:WD40 repeat protein